MAATATPIKFIVHSPAIMTNDEFNKFYAMAQDQITSSNLTAALDASSWFALSQKQQNEFYCRYSDAIGRVAILIVDKHLNRNQMFIGPKDDFEGYESAIQSMNEDTFNNFLDTIRPLAGDGSVPLHPRPQHGPAVTPLHQGGQQAQVNGPPRYMNQLDTLIPLALMGQAINAQGGTAGQGPATAGNLPGTTPITVTQTVTTPHAQPTKTGRPPNSWILFRADNHDKVKAANPGLDNNAISGLISQMWCDASAGVRDNYARMANLAREIHRAKNPAYKYKPRKSSEIKRRHARGTARADFMSSAELETSFTESDAVFTNVNGEPNQIENSTSLLGAGFDATYWTSR
uniref:MAT1-2-1 n=1 Tax=Acephala applanata TaxID=327282 RepID=D9J2E3_9HELO|nr:MAT1-2-1 [Acephala applanata]